MKSTNKKKLKKINLWRDQIIRYGLWYFIKTKFFRLIQPNTFYYKLILLSLETNVQPQIDVDTSFIVPINKKLLSEKFWYESDLSQSKEKLNKMLDYNSGVASISQYGKINGYAWSKNIGKAYGKKLRNNQVLFHTIFVYPEARRQGIGLALNAYLVKNLKPGQQPLVFVQKENRYALKSWKRLGFKPYLEISLVKHKEKTTILDVVELLSSPFTEQFQIVG